MVIKFREYDVDEIDNLMMINDFFNERMELTGLMVNYIKNGLNDDEFFNMILNAYDISFTNDDFSKLNNNNQVLSDVKYLNMNLLNLKEIDNNLYLSIVRYLRKLFNKKRIKQDLVALKQVHKLEVKKLRNKAIKLKKHHEDELNKYRKIIDKCNGHVKKYEKK